MKIQLVMGLAHPIRLGWVLAFSLCTSHNYCESIFSLPNLRTSNFLFCLAFLLVLYALFILLYIPLYSFSQLYVPTYKYTLPFIIVFRINYIDSEFTLIHHLFNRFYLAWITWLFSHYILFVIYCSWLIFYDLRAYTLEEFNNHMGLFHIINLLLLLLFALWEVTIFGNENMKNFRNSIHSQSDCKIICNYFYIE